MLNAQSLSRFPPIPVIRLFVLDNVALLGDVETVKELVPMSAYCCLCRDQRFSR